MQKYLTIRLATALSAIVFALYGCGGGGGGGSSAPVTTPPPTTSPPPQTPPASATPTFLVGQAGASVPATAVVNGSSVVLKRASLVAFDPQNTSDQRVLAAAGNYSNDGKIEYGVYDPVSKSLLEPHVRYVVFIQNGKIFKSNLVKGGPGTTPVQVSNETAADSLCSFNQKQLVDYTNAENTAIVYARRGADNTCFTADDEWRIVRLSMGPADAPLAAKQAISGLIDGAGKPIGWLALDGNQLARYDANFQNPTVLTAASGDAEEVSQSVGPFEQAIVRLGNTLYQYNGNTGTFTALFSLLFGTTPGTIQARTRDSQAVFLAVSNPADGTSRLYRVPLTTIDFSQLTSEPALMNVLSNSTSRVIYNLTTAGDVQQLKSIPKQGGPAVILPLLGETTLTGRRGVTLAAGNKVYYNVGQIGGPPVAGIINDDGSNAAETNSARWLGIGGSDDFANLSTVTAVARMIRADGVTFVAGRFDLFNYAGVTLKSFDPITGAQIQVLGTLPPVTMDFFSFNRNKSFDLGQATKTNLSGGFDADLYTANPDVAGSLVRVTRNIN